MSKNWFDYLEESELNVEYLVRNIARQKPNSVNELIDVCEKENQKTVTKPKDSHVISNPEHEADLCYAKWREFSNANSKITNETSIETIFALVIQTRHWYERAIRLKYSHGDISNIITSINSLKRVLQLVKQRFEEMKLSASSSANKLGDTVDTSSVVNGNSDISKPSSSDNTKDPAVENANIDLISKPTEGVESDENSNGARRSSTLSLTEENVTDDLCCISPFNQPNFSSIQRPPQLSRRSFNNQSESYLYRPSRYVPKWNINFKGVTPGLHVNDFLFQLEMMARADSIVVEDLIRYVHLFVSETAQQWYWVYMRHNPNVNWFQLRQAFESRFSSCEAERDTRKLIQRRRQKANESFNQYVLEIQTLNGRLNDRFSERELLEILRDNMIPALRHETLRIRTNSIEELRKICHEYETFWEESGFDFRSLQKSFQNRPHFQNSGNTSTRYTHNKSINNIELQDCSSNETSTAFEKLSLTEDGRDSDGNGDEIAAFERVTACFNCKQPNHRFFDCNIPITRKFCMGCGNEGVLKPECSRCISRKSNLNVKPNGARTGEPRSD